MRRIVAALMITVAGCKSLGGSAAGTCRVRYTTREEAPPVGGGERSDAVTLRVVEMADHRLRLEMNDCTLIAHEAPRAPNTNPHYRVVEGSSCDWDLPGLGRRHFTVADRPTPRDTTDGVGYEAYANFAGRELFIMLEAPVEAGQTRFDCEFERSP